MSKEIKDNWFIILGLDFYPVAEENEEKIKNEKTFNIFSFLLDEI